MTCREFAEFLSDWLDGDLAPVVAAEFVRHLKVCSHCDAYLQSMRATRTLGRLAARSADDRLPAEVPAALVRAILAARRAGVLDHSSRKSPRQSN